MDYVLGLHVLDKFTTTELCHKLCIFISIFMVEKNLYMSRKEKLRKQRVEKWTFVFVSEDLCCEVVASH